MSYWNSFDYFLFWIIKCVWLLTAVFSLRKSCLKVLTDHIVIHFIRRFFWTSCSFLFEFCSISLALILRQLFTIHCGIETV